MSKCKPKSTDEALSQITYPGAKELAGPKHKDQADLKMDVDSSKASRIAANGTKQIGGHAKKSK